MKVLHICTSDSGGAGLCCLRIHKALLDQGIDSKVLVLNKTSHAVPEVYDSPKFKVQSFLWKALNKFFRMIHLEVTSYNKAISLSYKLGFTCSIPTSIYDVSIHPLVKWADIIHLHWVDNFIDYPSFFKKVDKPIVWTQHDEALFNGVYHFPPYGETIVSELEKKYYPVKYEALHSAKSLNIVLLSKWMYNHFHNHEMIKGMNITVINNPVDCSLFTPIDKKEARKRMGLADDVVVFSFASQFISNPLKGLKILSDTLQKMGIPNAVILAIGNKVGYKELPLVRTVGLLNSTEELSIAYSCADYFIMPSLKEAFAQSPMESMACGVPAIVYPVSGSDELIKSINGVKANSFDQISLEVAIRKAMSTNYDKEAIRHNMIIRYSPETIAKEYIDYYNSIVEGGKVEHPKGQANFKTFIDSIFGSDMVNIDAIKGANKISGTFNFANGFKNFKDNLYEILTYLKSQYETEPKTFATILNQVSELGDYKNWQGAYAELLTYYAFTKAMRDFGFTLNLDVTRPREDSYALELGYKETNEDGYIPELDAYFDIKILGDTSKAMLENIINRVVNEKKFKEHCTIEPEYNIDDNEEVIQSNFNEIRSELESKLKEGITDVNIECVKNLSFRVLWGKGVLSTEGTFNPYRQAEQDKDMIFKRCTKKIMKGKPFFLVLVNFPWYNGKFDEFVNPDGVYYRSLARRTFCGYMHDSKTLASSVIPKFMGTELIKDVANHITGLVFIDDLNIKESGYRCYAYLNPNAVNKCYHLADLFNHVIQHGNKDQGRMDDFAHDNY